MRRKNRFGQYFIVCLLILCCVTTVADALPDEWDRVLSSTVFIETDVGRGSGFFVGSDRVATCYHIIAGASMGQVATKSKLFDIVRVTKYNSEWDLAILRVKESSINRNLKNPSPLPFGEGLDEGKKVYILGVSRDGKLLYSSGQVSNNSSVCGQHEFNITATAVSGSNGGPVLNISGEVIGIATRNLLYNSAVRVDYLKYLSDWEGQGEFPPLDVYNLNPCVLISLINMKIEMGAHDSAIEYVRIFDDDRLDPLKKQHLKQQIRRAVQKGGKLTKMQRLRLLAKWLRIVF